MKLKTMIIGALLGLAAVSSVSAQNVYGSVSIHTPNASVHIDNRPRATPYLGNGYWVQEYNQRRERWIPYYPAPGAVYPSQSRYYQPHYHNPELVYVVPAPVPRYRIVEQY